MADYFPRPLDSRSVQRDPFAGYGEFMAAAISVGDEGVEDFRPQQDTFYRTNLCALTPSLPLKPPNDYVIALHDPCMEDLLKEHKDTKSKIDSLLKMKYKFTKSRRRERRNLEHFVGALDELAEQEDVKPIDAGLILGSAPAGILELEHQVGDVIGKNPRKPTMNRRYNGGNLSCVKDESLRQYMCYPSGRNLADITVSEALQDKERGVRLGAESTLTLDPDYLVYEIDTQTVQGQMLGLARQGTKSILFQIHEDTKLNVVSEMQWNDSTSVSLNRYIPGRYAVAADKNIHVLADSQIIRTIPDLEPRFPIPDKWHTVHWGQYPFQIVSTDPTGIMLYDIRVSNDNKSTRLFELPHMTLGPSERITVSSPLTSVFHHILATNYSLILLDSRMPNHPVLKWNHCLQNPAMFMHSVTSNSGPDTVLLASQLSPEVCCFPMTLGDMDQGQSQPGSSRPAQIKGPPWHASSPRDFAVFARRQGCDIDPSVFKYKLDLPLTGICGMNFADKVDNFSVFQITSHGDLFAQSFKSDVKGDRTFRSGPGSQDLKLSDGVLNYAKDWLPQAEGLLNEATRETLADHTKIIDVSECGISCSRKEMFAHVLCPACCPGNSVALDDGVEDLCMSCGIVVTQAGSMAKATSDREIIPNDAPIEEDSEELISEDAILSHANEEHPSMLCYKLDQDDMNIQNEIKQWDQEVKQSRKKYLQEKAKKKGKTYHTNDTEDDEDDFVEDSEEDEESERISPDGAVVPQLEFTVDVPNDTLTEDGNSTPTKHVEAFSKTPDSPVRSPFLTVEEVAESVGSRKRKRGSKDSVLSFGSQQSSILSCPGFSMTPKSMKRRANLKSLSQPVASKSSASPVGVSLSQPATSSASRSLPFDFVRPVGAPAKRPITKSQVAQFKKRKKSVMGF